MIRAHQWRSTARAALPGQGGAGLALALLLAGQTVAAPPTTSGVAQKRMLGEQLYQRGVAGDPDRATSLVRALYAARQAEESGDLAGAASRFDVLLKQLAQSYRNRDAGEEEMGRLQRDYEERLATLSSLESALQAVLVEKGSEAAAEVDGEERAAALAEARSLAARGDLKPAIERVDQLYEETVALLARLRDNETLEYRLEFASAEEEYQYETRRFSTHEMLYTMKAAETVLGADKQERVDRLVERARLLARQAGEQAGTGNFDAAIESQEAATGEFVQALRYLGVFLPQ